MVAELALSLTQPKLDLLLELIKAKVREAGDCVMEIYRRDETVSFLKTDKSPVTNADLIANKIICDGIEALALGWPVISEESDLLPYSDRKNLNALWLVDPLDGTKDFIARTDQFTINVALIWKSRPVLGVVFAPALDRMFYAVKDLGAFEESSGDFRRLNPKDQACGTKRILVSSKHLDPKTKEFLMNFLGFEVIGMGSSLKICEIASRNAVLYPRFAPTWEWDTAASDIILSESGGAIIDQNNNRLVCNKPDLLNPEFIALLDFSKRMLHI